MQESYKYTKEAPQRIVVTIKQKAPAIKTIYIAEKRRFNSKKVTFFISFFFNCYVTFIRSYVFIRKAVAKKRYLTKYKKIA